MTTLDLVAASMFSAMGVASVIIGVTGTTLAPTAQVAIGSWLQDRLVPLVGWLEPIPDVVIGLALVAVAAMAVAISGRRRKPNSVDESASGGDCHEQSNETAESVDHTSHDGR